MYQREKVTYIFIFTFNRVCIPSKPSQRVREFSVMVNKISYPGRKELAHKDTILRKAFVKNKPTMTVWYEALVCTTVSLLRPLHC